MTPLLIRSLDIDAPVLGQTRRVTYADGALALYVPADQIELVLALLAGVAPAGRNPCLDIQVPNEIGPRGTAAPAPAPVIPAASPEVAAIVAAAYSPPADDPALEFPPRGASMAVPAEPTPVLSSQEIASAPAPYATPEPAVSGGVADTLRNATKLAEVVGYLVEQQGIRELDALVAECQRLAPEVPLLGKIANLPSRIERTLSVLGFA
jgi:hypothetical protein